MRDVCLIEQVGHLTRLVQVEITVEERHAGVVGGATTAQDQDRQHTEHADRHETHGSQFGGTKRLEAV